MKFEDLKDAVPFETVLVDGEGLEVFFVATHSLWDRGREVVLYIIDNLDLDYTLIERDEYELEDWHIKKENKKITLYRYTVEDRKNNVWQSPWCTDTFDYYSQAYKSLNLLKTEAKEVEVNCE